MNGLLHRIAARAAGTALAVRADIAPAYAAGWAGAAGMAEASDGGPAGRTAEPIGEIPADMPAEIPAEVPASAMSAASRAWPAQRAAMPADAGGRPVASDASHSAAALAAGSRAPGAPGPVRPDDAGAAPPVMLPELPAAPVPHHAAAAPEPAAIASGPAPLTALRRSAGDGNTGGAGDTGDTAGDPAPLLPRTPAATPLAAPPVPRDGAHRHGPAAGTAMAGAAGEGGTEVHIHIGRIDVTALQSAPAPRRRPAPAQAPMSLDGYLAKRGRA